jgi:two-component system sensor histidine kinase BarA
VAHDEILDRNTEVFRERPVAQIVDRELAIQRAGGRPELAAELHGMLLNSIPELKAAIESSWTTQDLDALYTQVHKLNGSTRYCGVPELEQLCETLETQIKRGNGDLESALRDLLKGIERLSETPADF